MQKGIWLKCEWRRVDLPPVYFDISVEMIERAMSDLKPAELDAFVKAVTDRAKLLATYGGEKRTDTSLRQELVRQELVREADNMPVEDEGDWDVGPLHVVDPRSRAVPPMPETHRRQWLAYINSDV